MCPRQQQAHMQPADMLSVCQQWLWTGAVSPVCSMRGFILSSSGCHQGQKEEEGGCGGTTALCVVRALSRTRCFLYLLCLRLALLPHTPINEYLRLLPYANGVLQRVSPLGRAHRLLRAGRVCFLGVWCLWQRFACVSYATAGWLEKKTADACWKCQGLTITRPTDTKPVTYYSAPAIMSGAIMSGFVNVRLGWCNRVATRGKYPQICPVSFMSGIRSKNPIRTLVN